MKTYSTTLVLALIVILQTGCQSTGTPAGVHPKAIPVGGGVDFEFEAPTDGVVFIVDSQKNQLVTSRSIRSGELYRLGDNALELVRLIGLREHGPSFTLRTDFGDGERQSFPEVPGMKTPTFALYFATFEQMEFTTDRLQPRADPTPAPSTEPSVDELEKILVQ
jgi:hypothetical protein